MSKLERLSSSLSIFSYRRGPGRKKDVPRETAAGVKVGSGDQVLLSGTILCTSPSQQACSLPREGESRLALKAGAS